MKEPRNYQDLRAQHSHAVTNPTEQNENSEKTADPPPAEPTRPSPTHSPSSGSTDIERFVYRGAETARHNDAVAQAQADARSDENAVDRNAVPSHKLDKESGKALLEADLKEAMGENNSNERTAETRNEGQGTPTHQLDKEAGKALLEADLKEARESGDPPETGRDSGRDR